MLPSNKMKFWLKNISYTVFANLFSMIISSIVILLVPKVLDIDNYGYFQIYLFYINYVGFLQFGWIDGIYLRYAGKQYKDLNKPILHTQFVMLGAFQILLCIFISVGGFVLDVNENILQIFIVTGICMILTNLRGMLLYVLQITFRIKEYSIVTVIGRVFYGVIIILLVLVRTSNFMPMIYADLIGRGVSLVFAICFCKDIVFGRFSGLKVSFEEAWSNLSVGIKLMLANIANLLIIGIVRWAIQIKWDVATFAKLSLTLSVSNLLSLFVSAIGAVIFPILKRTDIIKLDRVYLSLREVMTIILYIVLIFYYPIRSLLAMWLPKYKDSFYYMALLFPMCVYSCKTLLLGNSFLNALRKEKVIMVTNIATVILGILFTILNAFILNNLMLTVLSIVVLLAVRMLLAEYYIAKIFKISLVLENFLETTMTIVFILAGLILPGMDAVFLYGGVVCIYILLRKNKLKRSIQYMISKE